MNQEREDYADRDLAPLTKRYIWGLVLAGLAVIVVCGCLVG